MRYPTPKFWFLSGKNQVFNFKEHISSEDKHTLSSQVYFPIFSFLIGSREKKSWAMAINYPFLHKIQKTKILAPRFALMNFIFFRILLNIYSNTQTITINNRVYRFASSMKKVKPINASCVIDIFSLIWAYLKNQVLKKNSRQSGSGRGGS